MGDRRGGVMRSLFSTTFCNSYGQYTCAADTCSSFHFVSLLRLPSRTCQTIKLHPTALAVFVGSSFPPLSHFLVRSMCPSKRKVFQATSLGASIDVCPSRVPSSRNRHALLLLLPPGGRCFFSLSSFVCLPFPTRLGFKASVPSSSSR